MDKKIIIIYLFFVILYISVFPVDVGRYILVDENSNFTYKIENIVKTGNDYTATLFNKELGRKFEVRKDSTLPGFGLTDVEIEHLRRIVFEEEKRKIVKKVTGDIDKFNKENDISGIDLKDLGLEGAVDTLEPSDEEVEKMMNFIRVKEIGENHVLLEDVYRNGFWKLLLPTVSQMEFRAALNNSELIVRKAGDIISLDAEKEVYYGPETKIGNYSVSACHDNDYIYFFAECNVREPILKSQELFVLKYNAERQKYFYEAIVSEKYLMLVFFLIEENQYLDSIKSGKDLVFDIWDWEFPLRKGRFMYDSKAIWTMNRINIPEDSDISEIQLKGDGTHKFFYIYPDKGDSLTNDSVVSPESYLGDVFVPGTPNLNAKGSSTDIQVKADIRDDETSPYFSGKIRLEFKRRLDTGNNDDIKLNKATRYIFKPVDFGELDSLDFTRSTILKFVD